MRRLMAIAAVVAAMSGVHVASLPAAAPAGLTVPPPGYVYTATAECPFPGEVYQACEDQMQRFAAALQAAKAEGKLLLVVLGADWCPWCRALDKLLPTDQVLARKDEQFDYAGRYAMVNIAVSAVAKGKRITVPSGEAVAALVMSRAKGKRSGGIPDLLIIDPRSGDAINRKTDDLEDTWSNKGGGHDAAKVRDALREAHAKLRPTG